MRIAMIYGEFSSGIRGGFDIEGLYTRVGLTGSESSFFNLARSLSERQHEVVVFCVTPKETVHPSGFTAFPIVAIKGLPQLEGVDAVITWNEPDYLVFSPKGARRYCDQQLNDFPYCRQPNWRDLVDTWVSPSENHKQNVMKSEGIPLDRCVVIPNSVDLSLFAGEVERKNNRVVYCSSPDRGLHHLLAAWPAVRKQVSNAEMKVFYRMGPWLEQNLMENTEVGRRARYIHLALSKLSNMGVSVAGMIPNAEMARELKAATVLAYPCDPVKYTEGFGCSVLDAAAAGCVPIISDADALPSVHGAAAKVIGGSIDSGKWAATISNVLLGDVNMGHDKMKEHAEAHSHLKIADQWEKLLTC